MLISFNWIEEFIKTGLSPEDAGHALTMAGLEIEGLEAHGDDHVLEVNVTPNRSDSLSVLGIARELSAITGKDITLPPHDIEEGEETEFKLEILDPELCPRYAGRVIKSVKVEKSPDWIKTRLEKCGIRSINNIVDITNYVLLEFGHPLHAFDLSTLKESTIRVGVAGKGVKFRTLDDVEREMPEDTLMILDAKEPVAVAGVMGGADTEVSDSTTDIFLESAYFSPASIRRTSKVLGLSTEASYRFERGTDIIMLKHALNRAAKLIAELAGGTVYRIVDKWPTKVEFAPVKARPERINKVLGINLPRNEMVTILKKLGLGVDDDADNIIVTPPTFRPDITMEEDIIEEIARMYGYDNIPSSLPVASIQPTGGKSSPYISNIKNTMTVNGYNEAVNYSFMNIKSLDMLSIGQDDARRSCVKVLNPLRSEDEHMRSTLLPSLVENFAFNFAHGNSTVRLFETAKVFISTTEELPYEPLRIGAILHSGSGPALYKNNAEAFFQIKGVLNSLLGRLRIVKASYTKTSENFIHPGKGSDIFIDGQKVGYIGILLQEVLTRFGIKTKHEVAVFELELDLLFKYIPGTPEHKTITRYPYIERDVAIVIDKEITAAVALKSIRTHSTENIEDASVFDIYEGKGIPEDKKSLAINIRYRSQDRTLTDDEVDTMHETLVNELLLKTGGILRS
jgi:phenylalanyl-tRNA synthetase beta chain